MSKKTKNRSCDGAFTSNNSDPLSKKKKGVKGSTIDLGIRGAKSSETEEIRVTGLEMDKFGSPPARNECILEGKMRGFPSPVAHLSPHGFILESVQGDDEGEEEKEARSEYTQDPITGETRKKNKRLKKLKKRNSFQGMGVMVLEGNNSPNQSSKKSSVETLVVPEIPEGRIRGRYMSEGGQRLNNRVQDLMEIIKEEEEQFMKDHNIEKRSNDSFI